jgi:protein-S-isoprenylcysteine O-methyltransferase Ste14
VGQFTLLAGITAGGMVFPQAWSEQAWVVAVGWWLVFVAVLLGAGGALCLGGNLSPFPKPKAGSTLVQTGVYGVVRHPLYAALICGTLGWSLLRSSLIALIFSVVLGVFLDAKARREEVWLREVHAGYANYAKRVRRLIPWVY